MEIYELIDLKNRFDKHLNSDDYSFIGPEDQSLLSEFIQEANFFGPSDFFSTTYRRALKDQATILKTLMRLPSDTPLRIYIVIGSLEKSGVLMHSTIEEYCRRYNISF